MQKRRPSVFDAAVIAALALVAASCLRPAVAVDAEPLPAVVSAAELEALVDQPVDIASSAYVYRADRAADANPPDGWLAILHYAHLPLNQPVDVNAAAIKPVLCGLLWEEIRPIEQVELSWPAAAKRRPTPRELTITTLNAQGAASSWWNHLSAVRAETTPTVSADGKSYLYDLEQDTCGLVVALADGKIAADYDVPSVRVLVADVWKRMDVEIEWGFDPATLDKDYSGRVETYDGKIAALRPLEGDTTTAASEASRWRSIGKSNGRRGIKLSLLYQGNSRWRKTHPFTSQLDDVARTIVTLWTAAGNFSFLAADLENGPILAPEYGFFVRRTPDAESTSPDQRLGPRMRQVLLASKMDSIADNTSLRGWGDRGNMPWFGGNPTDKAISTLGITLPAKSLAMHPGPRRDVAVGWRSPIQGQVKVSGSVAHAQAGGNGIAWSVVRDTKTNREVLARGLSGGSGVQTLVGTGNAQSLSEIAVEPGDLLSLVVAANGSHVCDTTVVELVISEIGGGRVWDLTRDVVDSIHSNPHPDSQGHADVWLFYRGRPLATEVSLSEPPLVLRSQAASAQEFGSELQARKLSTIRQQTRAHAESTWEGAVAAMYGGTPPAHPTPPAGFEPKMQVRVPSARLTAQWNLGAWHLMRHAQKNPRTGRLWFDDFPYGILAAETHLILTVLDRIGWHAAAADGFDQWVSLPNDPDATGHHAEALPDRPTGLFSDGHGCLTHAVGPDGVGGQMDGIHAFGPGAIGLSLTEHYWLSGDIAWLKASAARIKANAEWMLRQRRLMTSVIPGGERLWCRGLQPPLQLTPDSGGLWMHFYESEAYYLASIVRLAATLSAIDPAQGKRLMAEAESYRQQLRAAVERSIALSPVVAVRDGTFHSVIPPACYVRGLASGAWGWRRDGSGGHAGPLYWDTVQSAAALVSPAGVLPANDPRVQGYLDVLEDRLLLENANVEQRCHGDWFAAGWQYQAGLERTADMHLAGDDVPVFLRSLLNGYAVDILPDAGYTFNEHAVHGPPDKIFEEAAFLSRFRDLLVMEDGQNLWLARATPRAWLAQGQTISVSHAPTHFGEVDYEIVSDVGHGKISATIKMPSRNPAEQVWLRLRHPSSAPIKSVTVNGSAWKDFDAAREIVMLHGLAETVHVVVDY